jgi:hypothetical protein
MKIARSFNCGFDRQNSQAPEGRKNFGNGLSAAPPGLDLFWWLLTAVETAGYFRLSLRDEAKPPLREMGGLITFRRFVG